MTNSNSLGNKYYVFLMVFLGMLTAFGPFVTDMYLPTLPSMADFFHTGVSQVQGGLAASMFGLAIGQLFFGPLSDKYGRRIILMIALLLFAISTVASIYSPTIEFFNICRFIQGLGGAGGIVLSRSIATDCFSGKDLAKALAIVGAINGIAPVSAPVIGGLVAQSVGWKGIFWILLGIGMVLIAMCLVFKESLTKENYYHGSVLSLMKAFPQLLKMKYLVIYVVLFAFAQGVLFAYISSASFIIQNHFQYSALTFSLVFAANAVALGIGNSVVLKFRKMENAALCGAIGMTFFAVLQLGLHYFVDNFFVYEGLTFMMLLFTGFIFTSSTTLTMDEGREHIGAASAIFGAIGFMAGGLVSPLVGMGNILTTTFIITTLSCVCALIFAVLAVKRVRA